MHRSFLHSKQTRGGLPTKWMNAGCIATETAEHKVHSLTGSPHWNPPSHHSLLFVELASEFTVLSTELQVPSWTGLAVWQVVAFTRLSGRPWVEFLKKKGVKDGL